jgi:hypothetical protein
MHVKITKKNTSIVITNNHQRLRRDHHHILGNQKPWSTKQINLMISDIKSTVSNVSGFKFPSSETQRYTGAEL